ncbi:hypothetical protein [Pedobacter alluvionis]|uniref:Uncharacterized protein n=1 Tax=Pedobacter alluvionis TaxID=475253 RepID=A0A497XSU1_9SPHI|nr:hypothetical protein [Pedobacter alluvionis]RLJ72510.1 hypothetical protein BCL90_4131 [Pedobacter alluvionis]TFB28168.1 hypothetical protein E3V97_24430 [Pedobacter alluvionis]
MRIGVISEGHADRAVILNIIKGVTGLDDSDIKAILPIRALDETDKARLKAKEEFGGWSSVKNECEKRTLIDEFLSIEGQDFVVIHLDTAECHEYGVQRPNKKENGYSKKVIELVIDQVNSWLGAISKNSFLYAIAVEETDAWILPIFESKDSSTIYKAKEKLATVLAKKDLNSKSDYNNFLILSKPFLNSRAVKRGKFLDYNYSLKAFVDEVQTKISPKLQN